MMIAWIVLVVLVVAAVLVDDLPNRRRPFKARADDELARIRNRRERTAERAETEAGEQANRPANWR